MNCANSNDVIYIKQGDEKDIPLSVGPMCKLHNDDEPVTVEKVEVYLGTTMKEYLADGTGDITYDGELYYYHVTQDETLAMKTGNTFMDIRVKYSDGTVLGILNKIAVKVVPASSERVL